jgi:hypothetical protein
MAKAPGRKAKVRASHDEPPPRAPSVSPEESARRTLGWGAGALILGLAVVGIGSDDLGVLPVLAGLLILVYGIHKYGRLGPEEERAAAVAEGAPAKAPPSVPPSPDLEAAQSTVWTGIWMGGLVAVAGLAVALGSAGGSGVKVVLAYGAILGGGIRAFRGLSSLPRVSPAPASVEHGVENRVEKRRRLNKSAPP